MSNRLIVPVNGFKQESFPEDEDQAFRPMWDSMSADEQMAIRLRVQQKEKHISPPGTFKHIPPLLDKKRIEEGIVDHFFTREAATFEYVYIYQLPYRKATAPGDSPIILPDITADRMSYDGPRGIIISAGPHALNVLWSNGMDIGHTVTFARHSPWRITMAVFSGKEEVALEMKVGDIVGSEDLMADLMSGKVRYVRGADGQVQVETTEHSCTPENPLSSDGAM